MDLESAYEISIVIEICTKSFNASIICNYIDRGTG